MPLETVTDPEGDWEFTNESLAKRVEANERLLNLLQQFESFSKTRFAKPVATTVGDDWVGVPVRARKLGVTMRTLYKLLDAGELPAYKFGRVIRIKRADVEAFLDRGQVQAGRAHRAGDDLAVLTTKEPPTRTSARVGGRCPSWPDLSRCRAGSW